MLRTILILATVSLLCSVSYAQTKIGDDVLNIDSASILELQSTSRGFLPSRMTTAQRDAQTNWDQAHIIFNTTENCLQIYSGILWECLQQGTPIDTSIYKQNGTLQSDRIVTMNGSDLTFDGSRDIIITDDGRLGIGDPSPDALLDVEGGTVRLSDYGSGVNSGQRTFLLGVDLDGDVITVDTSSVGTDDQIIDALFIRNDTLFISLEDDGVSDLFVNLSSYLDDINIYQTDDTLTANRTVHMDGKYLQFSNSDGRTRTRIENDGDLSQTGRNITHTLTDTSQDLQLKLSAEGAFSTIGTSSDHPLNIIQNDVTAISVKTDEYIRLNNYGDGNRSGTPAYIIGVDTDGDLLDVDLSSVSDTDWLALGGSSADNILDTIYTFGNVGINTNSPDASLHVVDQPDTYAGPWAIIEGGGGVRANTALRLYDKGTAANNENILEFAHQVAGNPVPLATIRSNTESNLHADGADLILETSSDDTGTLNANQLYLNNDGNVGIGTSTPDEELHINGDMRLDGAFEDKDGDAGSSGNVLTSTVTGTDWVAASTVGTDNQIIDSLALEGDNLQIGIESDINGLQTLDLSPLTDTDWLAVNGSRATSINDSIYTMGRVGIGTTSPAGKLHISTEGSEDILITRFDNDASNDLDLDFIGGEGTSGAPTQYSGLSTGNRMGGIRFRSYVDPSAFFSNPLDAFAPIAEIAGETDGTYSTSSAPGKLVFGTTAQGSNRPSERMVIRNDGKVGINIAAPDELLHIGGNMRLDGAFEDKDGDAGSSGNVLTSTVTGTDWVVASTVGTDNQTIDLFNINGSNELELSLERDSEAAQIVDLSGYLDDQTVTITGAGINAVTGTYPNFTITGTELDGSTTNETITNFTYTASSGRLRITESGSNYDAFVSVMTGATGGANGVRGLVPNAAAGEQTYLLTGGGTWVDPTTLSGINIYTGNGTLDANRTIGLSTFDLIFDGTTDVIIESGGDVGIGTTSPDAKLHVAGNLRLDEEFEDKDGDAGSSGDVLTSTGTGTDWVAASTIGSDDQIVDSLALVGSNLQLGIEDDVNGLQVVDLSPLQGGSVGLHTDVDVTTIAPGSGDVLAWDGSNFVPQETDNGYTIFSVWAEESGALNATGDTEWAYGNGDNTPAGHGIVIPVDCELWAMSLDHEGGANTIVRVVKNADETLSSYQVTTTASEQDYVSFGSPLSFVAGDVINFKTISASATGASGRVSAWFRIRSTPASTSLLNDLLDVSAGSIADGEILVFNGGSFVPGTDSDEQTVDTFSINGSNVLQLSLENDGEAAQTVDLSGYLDDQTVAITGAGINAVTGTYPNFTITGTEVDGSTTNETITNFAYTSATGRLRITESGSNYDAFVPLMTGATGGAAGERGLVPAAAAGQQTYLLTGAGTWFDPSSFSGANIYTDNGSLDANRTVTLNSRSLTFNGTGTGDVIIEADGDVGIGTTSPGARLEVDGGSVIFDEYGVGTYADTTADYILATNPAGDVVELNTAKNTRWFYPPAVVIDASDLDTAATLDLHADYVNQFTGAGMVSLISSDGAFGEVPYYEQDELEYYITFYDDTILDNVSIDANGVMTYDIIAVPFDNYTVINVVFVIK